jgi:hypothetical protein
MVDTPRSLPEPCNHAPELHAGDDTASRRLAAAYGRWREHYAGCARCNVQSWYEPETVALCHVGRERFADWNRLAVVRSVRVVDTPPQTGYPVPFYANHAKPSEG